MRTRGLYFLLITAAMGQVLWGADYRWGAFTGGADGLELGGGRPSPWFYSELHFYYFTLAVFAVVTALICIIIVSPFGLTLKSIRDREVRSQTLGYVTYTHKYLAFIIAGIAATIAGILSGAYNGIASPSDLALDQSFAVMLMVIFGGSGTLAGPIVGAILITSLQFELSTFWPNAWPIILGAIYVFATIYLPDGIVRGFAAFRQPFESTEQGGGCLPIPPICRKPQKFLRYSRPSRARLSSVERWAETRGRSLPLHSKASAKASAIYGCFLTSRFPSGLASGSGSSD